LYIGSKQGMEKIILLEHHLAFKPILTGKLRRYFTIKNLWDIFKIPFGVIQSLWHIYKFKPDVIFSKGGYVSVPVMVAGFILRKKTILHESDLSIGLANKISAFFADEILLGHEDTKKFFPNKKSITVGIPVRKFIYNGDKNKAAKLLEFPMRKPVILIIGGSLGAQFINEIVLSSLEKLLPKFNVIHVTGKNFSKQDTSKFSNYRRFDFVDQELADFYDLADIIISRAGANTLAELSCLNKKIILIPLPKSSSRGDQIENAQNFQKSHQAKIIDQEKLTSKILIETIQDILAEKKAINPLESINQHAAKKILTIFSHYNSQ